jgi:putative Mg2+ transporter-C (MgtC) family protein
LPIYSVYSLIPKIRVQTTYKAIMDIYNFSIPNEDLVKVGLSVLCGGVLGIERQYKNKTAGFRTIILICMGSTLFTLVAFRAGAGVNINIVTGIGFIGAGVIFKDNLSVNGLTTAAVIWVSAAVGIAIGTNNYMLGIITSVLTIFVLWSFHFLENYMEKVHHDKVYNLVFSNNDYNQYIMLEETVKAHHLVLMLVQINKNDENLRAVIKVTGHKKRISKLDQELLTLPQVISF